MSPSGGGFTSVAAALASITGASAVNPFVVHVGPGVYDELSYYERWISSATNLLLEKGVIHVDELGRKMSEIEQRWRQARDSAA